MRQILITLSLVSSYLLQAQISVPTQGSTWNYSYSNISESGRVELVVSKDSVVLGKPSKVITRTWYSDVVNSERSIDTFVQESYIISIEDSVLSYFTGSEFDTLYDFAAQVGASWTVQDYSNTELTIAVEGEGRDTFLGKSLMLSYMSLGSIVFRDTVYEKMLSGHRFFIPWDYKASLLDGHVGGDLRCFKSNGSLSYTNPEWEVTGNSCIHLLLGVNNLVYLESASVFPNPCKDNFIVALPQGSNEVIVGMEIYDNLGNLQLSYNNMERLRFVRLEHNLPPSFYVLKIETESGLHSSRLIVQ